VWVLSDAINAKTADACRLMKSAKSGATCGTTYSVEDAGGATKSTASGQCFGRQPDGGAWGAASIPCTQGASNGGGSGPAVLTRTGDPTKVLLRGVVVTPTTFFTGEVLVEGSLITCVAASCSSQLGAATASIVQTNGVIFPGLIDTHNHILFDTFDATDWSPSKVYTNHNQWTEEPRYQALVNAKQWLNGETSSSPVSLGCELDKYGEIKGLIAGTTSIVGAANPANKSCYGSLARTIDQSPNGLGTDDMQVSTLFPTTSSADSICKNLADGKTNAFVVHVGEGVDATALKEFATLGTVSTTDGCLDVSATTIVHGAAFGATEFSAMAADGMSLVWSPQSNVFLYGGGTDLSKTANIPLARSHGINVALAPDWSIGGSQNILDELRFARRVDSAEWGTSLTSQNLVEMVTVNAAKALHLDAVIGSLAVGMRADLMVIGGDGTAPYDALLAAKPADVRLVMVDGKSLYGDPQLEALGPAGPGCESLGVCGDTKFLCVAEAGGTASNKLGQTLEQIESAISTALTSYDGLKLSAWDFSPITPLVSCP
jgi:cytosine/adenosine deaminase-related metal-dependent hydrolase